MAKEINGTGNEMITIASKVSRDDKAKIKAIASLFGMSFYELLQSLLLGMLRYFDIGKNSTYGHNAMMDALFIAIRSIQGSYNPLLKRDRKKRRVRSAILFVEESPKKKPQLLSVSINDGGQIMESLNFDRMVSDFLGCIDPDALKRLDILKNELGFFSITHTLHEIIMWHSNPIDENREYIKKLFEDIRIPSGQAINDDIMYKRGKRQNVDEYTTITPSQTFRADI